MEQPVKNNSDILADQQAFLATLKRARAYYSKFSGVIGVAFGQKNKASVYKDEISIVIIVEEKKAAEDIPVGERIAEFFEGYLTDVNTPKTFQFGACNNSAEYSTIKGGIQISPPVNNLTGAWDMGTLGCIVRKKNNNDRENVHILSNAHVLYGAGNVQGNYIYHPWPPTPSGIPNLGPSNSLGPVAALAYFGNFPYTPPGEVAPREFFIDCATARINIDCKSLGTSCTKDVIHYDTSITDLSLGGFDTISDVRNIINDVSIIGQPVFKVGRTTGKTRGIVRLVNWMEPSGDGHLKELIVIDFDTSSPNGSPSNCNGHAQFAEKGDSGSLVVDEQRRAIGLLFGVPPDGITIAHPSFACHILPVLETLGFCIPTDGGTSRCSCAAADGTGLAPPPAAGAGAGGGAIGIIGGSLASKKINDPAGFLQPEPLTEAQQERLTGLLQAFRSTARGRALHEAFRHVRREIGYLVRNVRPVTVAWHRNKGPAFFACFLNHLRGDAPDFPHEIKEVRLSTLLDKMEMELTHYGSKPLQETIQYYGNDLKRMLLDWNDVHEFLDYLDKNEMQ